MEVSNVAPPHISRLKRFGRRCATALAVANKSCVRTRVAMSDWWASRKRSVRDQKTLFFSSPGRKFLGTQLLQELAGS